MGMMFDRRTKPDSEIPTSSMADIAFLLIIFFMVTTVFSATKGLELKLPVDKEDNSPIEEDESVFIHVYADRILVDCQPMETTEILEYLEPKLQVNQRKPVILYTDADARYADMIKVYDVLAEVRDDPVEGAEWQFKVQNIAIPTRSEVDEYIALFGVNPFETQCGG